tara:strand:+ start:3616 stop:3849 length:234 start_codon:yes stop_codon:yes gene_type:complete
MNCRCAKKTCERCEEYGKKCRKYKTLFIKQETKNDELVEMLESLIESQQKIVEYLDKLKVVGVDIKKNTSQSFSKDE